MSVTTQITAESGELVGRSGAANPLKGQPRIKKEDGLPPQVVFEIWSPGNTKESKQRAEIERAAREATKLRELGVDPEKL
jgi:Uma2 family endonuclease